LLKGYLIVFNFSIQNSFLQIALQKKEEKKKERRKAYEEMRKKGEEEFGRPSKAVQEAMQKALEASRPRAEEKERKAAEKSKKKAEEDAIAIQKAIEEAKKKAEEEARKKAEEEAKLKAEEEARKKAEEEEQALPEGGQYVMTVDSNGRVSGYFTNDMMSMYYEISGNVDDLGAFNGTARCNPNPPLGGGQGFCIEQIATGKMKGKFTSPPNIRGSGSMTLGTICSGSWK